jgi:uncharacterized membrane protein YagU involved in acid resistance
MNASAFQKAAQYAMICAMVVFATTLVFYLTDFIFWFFGLIPRLIIGIVFLITFIIVMMNWKKSQTEIKYGQALKFGLMVILIYVILMFLLDMVFMYLIAPNFNEQMLSHMMNSMEKMHVPQDKLDETRAKFEKNQTSPIIGALMTMGGRAVLDFLLLLIVAIFTRKEKDLNSISTN